MNRLPAQHPLRKAQWIWPQSYMYLVNHFAQFRRDFELPFVPAKAPFFITADKAYKLWANGRYVCRGPARGYQSHWPYDEVDLAPYLRPGKNILAVEAYNPGIDTFQYLHQTAAGFLCAGEWESFHLVSDGQWKMRRSPAHKRTTARFSMQIDFQEHVDARLDDRTWISDPAPPADWRAEIFPEGGQQFLAGAYGRAPWFDLEERGIPLLRETLEAPQRISAQVSGPNSEGWRDWENVSWPWVREVLALEKWERVGALAGEVQGSSFAFTLEPAGEGQFKAITLAMAKYAVGNLLVEVEGAEGGEVLDFQFEECMNGNRPALHEPGRACMSAMANRLIPKKGRTVHEFFHPLGFTVVTVVGRGLTAALKLRVSVRCVGYPYTMGGAFACSDDALHRIHEACRHTQQICSLDAYVDTPWREQAQWWGDARVQAKNTFFLDGDARLLARGIESIAGQTTPEGLTYGHAPTSAHNCILPDFALTWILTVHDHWYQTGETALLRAMLPRIHTILAYFDKPEVRHPSGLLRHDRRFWYFGDWSTLFKGELPTFLNMWYLVTLRHLAAMGKAAGLKAEAAEWTKRADRHEKVVLAHCFDKGKQMFVGGLDEALVPKAEFSVHEQTLALMLGLCPKAHDVMMRERILPFLRGEKVDGPIPSAFWATYTFEEAAKRGHGERVIEFIRKKWTPMLATGTTWEGYEWSDLKGGGTVSHAWTAHPSFHFVNILAGITQAEPAWKAVRFEPVFAAGIMHASATVPSPRGPIAAKWRREGDHAMTELTLPDGVKAEMKVGAKVQKVSGPGVFHLDAAIGG